MTTVTAKQFAVLTAICPVSSAEYAEHDTGSTWTDAAEIAAQTDLPVASVAGVLGTLVQRGFIYTEDEVNGRKVDICCISEEGARFIAANPKGHDLNDEIEAVEELLAEDVYADMSVMGIAEDCFAEHGLNDAAVDMMVEIMARYPGKTNSAAYTANARSFCRGYIAGAKRKTA
jgi:DNA-binding MarR family transcriptional regulator